MKKSFDDLLAGDRLVFDDGSEAVVIEGSEEDAVYVESDDGSYAGYLYRVDYDDRVVEVIPFEKGVAPGEE